MGGDHWATKDGKNDRERSDCLSLLDSFGALSRAQTHLSVYWSTPTLDSMIAN